MIRIEILEQIHMFVGTWCMTELALKMNGGGDWFKMAEYKDVHSLPLVRAPKSQLIAERSSTGRHWNSPKKIPHIQRQRRSHNEIAEGVQSQ